MSSDNRERGNDSATGGPKVHTNRSGRDKNDFFSDAYEPPRMAAAISGGGVLVYWEVSADGEGRCYAEIEDERIDRAVLRLLLNDTAPPHFMPQSWPVNLFEDMRLAVDLYTLPPEQDFKKLHERCLDALQIMCEPTKEQAIILVARKEQIVRNYALSQMQRWSESWKSQQPKSLTNPTRVYLKR